MSGSLRRKLELAPGYKNSVLEVRSRYYNLNEEAASEFDRFLVNELIRPLLEDTPRPSGSKWEKWPHGSHNDEWEFRKLSFTMPGLTGDPGEGRLMYLINLTTDAIRLLWLYTHEQFSGRPSDSSLKAALPSRSEP